MTETSKSNFLPDDFQPPEIHYSGDFVIRKLTIHDVIKDYDAVMSSIDHLRGTFGPENSWPSKDMSIEQNLIDLGWHQKEFEERRSFAYTITNNENTKCIGCLYIYPLEDVPQGAQIFFWVRRSAYEEGLESIILNEIKKWLASIWPFERIVFPYRID